MRAAAEGAERPLSPGGWVVALVLGAGLLFPGSGVMAQETSVLTLSEALGLAQRHNPDYRMARNDLELSDAGRREAWGAFLPDLNLSVGSGVNWDRRLVSVDNFGIPIDNPYSSWNRSFSSSQWVGGDIMLFQGGQRFSELSAQAAQGRAREATASSRLRTVRAEVIRAYLHAQAQQANHQVEEELLQARQADLAMAERMFELAGATRVEVLAAELALQRQEQRIQQALAQLQQNLLTLRSAIGDPGMDEFVLPRETQEPFDPEGLDLEALVARALASSPLIHEQTAQVDIGVARARAARGSRWPTLSLSYGFNQRNYEAFDPWPGEGRYGSTSLSVSLPLFSRFQNSARIAEAQVASDNAIENLRKTRLQVEEDTRSRFIAFRTAYAGYQIALRSQEIAQERLTLAREQFRQGSRTFTEFQQDIDAAASAEREVITQLFGWAEARANLEETVGELGMGGGA